MTEKEFKVKVDNSRHFLAALVIVVFSLQSLAANCPNDKPSPTKSGYITGIGVGQSYEGAKSKALADAMGFFGVRISNQMQITDDNETSTVNREIKVQVEALAKGAEVLSDCEINDNHKVTIGIKKTTIRQLIENRANQRTAFANNLKGKDQITPQEQVLLAKYRAEDAKDRETWILLGNAEVLYPAVDLNVKAKASLTKYHLTASGELAEATLSDVAAKLKTIGITLTDNGQELVWKCSMTLGSVVGTAQRYKASCALSVDGLGVEPFEVGGISRADAVNARVKQMVIDRMAAH